MNIVRQVARLAEAANGLLAALAATRVIDDPTK